MYKKLIFLTSFLLVLSLVGNAMAQIDPATVETGHVYLLEDIVDATVSDDSANENTGIVVGEPTVVDGLNGKALQFDGIDDGVDIPDSEFINVTGGPFQNRTVIAVFNCADVTKPEKQTVFEEGGLTRGLTIYVFDGQVYVGGWNKAEYQWNPGSWLSAPIESNQWYTAALVIRNGADAQQDYKFEMWLDGELIGTAPGGQIYNHGNDNAIGYTNQNNVFHDGNASGDGWYFEGMIDEVWILNEAVGELPYANTPTPANDEVDVKAAPKLSWLAPDTTFQHDLYLGTDADLVAAGDASVAMGSLSEASYTVDPNFPLNRGTTYYWKVDVLTGSARASELIPGNVWNFRIADLNTASWLAAAGKDSPTYIDTFVENGPYDIGALSGDITYEFVVLSNPDEQQASMALIGRHGHGDTTVALKYEQWNNTGTYGATVFGVVDLDYGVPTSPGEYTVLTFVSSETTNTTALYVNGASAGSVDSAITLAGIVGIGQAIQDPNGESFIDNFDGTIFGVAIYDMALADEQIAAHADAYFNPVTEIIPVDPGTEGLVAYYNFENDANDSSGNENHGTLVGDPVFVDGPMGFGTALEFNGDDYVDCGNGDTLQIQDAITMSFWFKVVAFENTWEAMLSKGDSAYRVSRGPGDGDATHMGISGTTGGGGNGWFNGVTLVTGGQWHHFAGTYDGAEGRIYIDGVLDATTEATGQINIETENLWIGNNSQNVDRFFHGVMDEVMLYNRALADVEVMYLAGLRATPVDPGTDNLAAAYLFDADAADSSGNGLDGTLLGDAHVADGVLVLDGDDDAVAIPGIGDALEEFSFVMSVYPTVDQTALAFSGGINTDSWTGGIHFKLNNGLINVGVNGLAGGDVVGTSIIEPNMWTQLALTVSPDEVAVYVNGEKEGSRVGEVVPAVNVGAATIGAWNNGGTDVQREMTGMMDDVLFFNKALSVGEVRYLAGFRAMDNPGTDALIAAYPFENDVLDSSGNANDATVNGDPAFVEGLVGMALEFDGDGDFLDCGANPILALTDAVSISAWIKVAVAGADHKVGGNQDGANGGYKMSVYGDKIEFEIRTAANAAHLNRSVDGGTIIEVDTWYHVVGVYSLEDGYIRTYVDGELDRELLTTEALGASPGSLVIGAEPFNTGSYNFNGIMDEVQVYNKALTAAEARYIANN